VRGWNVKQLVFALLLGSALSVALVLCQAGCAGTKPKSSGIRKETVRTFTEVKARTETGARVVEVNGSEDGLQVEIAVRRKRICITTRTPFVEARLIDADGNAVGEPQVSKGRVEVSRADCGLDSEAGAQVAITSWDGHTFVGRTDSAGQTTIKLDSKKLTLWPDRHWATVAVDGENVEHLDPPAAAFVEQVAASGDLTQYKRFALRFSETEAWKALEPRYQALQDEIEEAERQRAETERREAEWARKAELNAWRKAARAVISEAQRLGRRGRWDEAYMALQDIVAKPDEPLYRKITDLQAKADKRSRLPREVRLLRAMKAREIEIDIDPELVPRLRNFFAAASVHNYIFAATSARDNSSPYVNFFNSPVLVRFEPDRISVSLRFACAGSFVEGDRCRHPFSGEEAGRIAEQLCPDLWPMMYWRYAFVAQGSVSAKTDEDMEVWRQWNPQYVTVRVWNGFGEHLAFVWRMHGEWWRSQPPMFLIDRFGNSALVPSEWYKLPAKDARGQATIVSDLGRFLDNSGCELSH